MAAAAHRLFKHQEGQGSPGIRTWAPAVSLLAPPAPSLRPQEASPCEASRVVGHPVLPTATEFFVQGL